MGGKRLTPTRPHHAHTKGADAAPAPPQESAPHPHAAPTAGARGQQRREHTQHKKEGKRPENREQARTQEPATHTHRAAGPERVHDHKGARPPCARAQGQEEKRLGKASKKKQTQTQSRDLWREKKPSRASRLAGRRNPHLVQQRPRAVTSAARPSSNAVPGGQGRGLARARARRGKPSGAPFFFLLFNNARPQVGLAAARSGAFMPAVTYRLRTCSPPLRQARGARGRCDAARQSSGCHRSP